MRGAEVISLGCRLNLAESESIRALAAGASDLVIVNSCAVTAEAVRQTRQAIRRAHARRPGARLLVTGCAAAVERAKLAAMPQVSGLVDNAAKLDPAAYGLAAPRPGAPAARHSRAFVAVQNGCDHACTFCIIPQGRGRSRSHGEAAIFTAIEAGLAAGAGEIVLTGVDVTSFGHDLPGSPRLGSLVLAILDRFPALRRLRLSSLDGAEIDPLLLDLICGEPRVMPHLHLSLQSGDPLILKRMKRRHSRDQAVRLVETVRARRAEVSIGADLIAGFPTESAAMHANNLSLIAACDIVHGHVFPYSPRPGTPAARMPQIPRELARTRAAELRAAIAARRDAWLETLIGRPQQVLAERDGTGHAENFSRFRLPADAAPGAVLTLTATGLDQGLLQCRGGTR